MRWPLAHSVDPDCWAGILDDLMLRIGHRFRRVEARRRAGRLWWACWPACPARTAGPSPSMPGTRRRAACSICCPGRAGTPTACAMTSAASLRSIWATPDKRRTTPLVQLLATGWSHAHGGKPLNLVPCRWRMTRFVTGLHENYLQGQVRSSLDSSHPTRRMGAVAVLGEIGRSYSSRPTAAPDGVGPVSPARVGREMLTRRGVTERGQCAGRR